MAWLNTALKEKAFALRFMMNYDSFWLAGVRDDPRFVALRRQVLATTFKE